jgi:hypothetical protein
MGVTGGSCGQDTSTSWMGMWTCQDSLTPPATTVRPSSRRISRAPLSLSELVLSRHPWSRAAGSAASRLSGSGRALRLPEPMLSRPGATALRLGAALRAQAGRSQSRWDRLLHAVESAGGEIYRLIQSPLRRWRAEHRVRRHSTLQDLIDDQPLSGKTTGQPHARFGHFRYPADLRRVWSDQHKTDVRELRHDLCI